MLIGKDIFGKIKQKRFMEESVMLKNETIDNILARESCLDFTGEPVPEEAIETLLAAGRHAPTSGGRQPWHFTVVTDPKILDDISYLVHGNFLEMMSKIKEDEKMNKIIQAIDDNMENVGGHMSETHDKWRERKQKIDENVGSSFEEATKNVRTDLEEKAQLLKDLIF